MAIEYKWAHNKIKLQRAIAHVTAKGGQVTEEAIRARYEELGGLVIEIAQEREELTLDKLSIDSLKEKAAELEIDITELKTKKDLISAIEAAEAD